MDFRAILAGVMPVLLSVVMTAASAKAQAGEVIYESAVMGEGGQADGALVGSARWLGALFTTEKHYRVTALGGHLASNDGQDVFIAIFPTDGEFPASPRDINDAHFVTTTVPPALSEDHRVTTDFALPPGQWAIVVGGGPEMPAYYARLARTNTTRGAPRFVRGTSSQWSAYDQPGIRLFLEGTSPCGDGVVQPEEQCDDGNVSNRDACLNSCRNAICGDGFTRLEEECDDGNQRNGDGCDPGCRREVVVRELSQDSPSSGCALVAHGSRTDMRWPFVVLACWAGFWITARSRRGRLGRAALGCVRGDLRRGVPVTT